MRKDPMGVDIAHQECVYVIISDIQLSVNLVGCKSWTGLNSIHCNSISVKIDDNSNAVINQTGHFANPKYKFSVLFLNLWLFFVLPVLYDEKQQFENKMFVSLLTYSRQLHSFSYKYLHVEQGIWRCDLYLLIEI